MRTYGDKRVVQSLKRIRTGLPEVFNDDEYKNLLLRRVKARFMQGVDPNGQPWANLTQKTIETKRKKGYPRPEQILYATGRMYEAIQVISRGNAGIFAVSTGLGFRIGIEDADILERAYIHNYGYGIVQRRFLGISNDDFKSYQNYVRRRLRDLVRTS